METGLDNNDSKPDWHATMAGVFSGLTGDSSDPPVSAGGHGHGHGPASTISAFFTSHGLEREEKEDQRAGKDAETDGHGEPSNPLEAKHRADNLTGSWTLIGDYQDTPASPESSRPDSPPASEDGIVDIIFVSFPSRMETHAKLSPRHYGEFVKIMRAKVKDIQTYRGTANYSIQHLDWPAGNPDDPFHAKSIAPGTDSGPVHHLADDDKANQEKIVRMVARITFDVEEEIDPKREFSKTLFFGDWVSPARGEKDCFVEIQIKRVSGSDAELLASCGVNADLVWLSLLDVVRGEDGGVTVLGSEKGVANVIRFDAQKNREAAAAASKNDDVVMADDVPGTAATAPTTSTGGPPAAPPFSDKGKSVERSTAHAGVPPRSYVEDVAPRFQEGSATGGSLSLNAATVRARLRKELYKRLEHLTALMPKTPEFGARVAESFVYVVKVVAIPRPTDGSYVNTFTGPAVPQRFATVLGTAGWVVPPLAERLAHRASCPPRAKALRGSRNFVGLPRPSVQRALPMKLDESDASPAAVLGDPAPLWMGVCDPTLEDVYHMVWQMLAGKQYVGFSVGLGFGRPRKSDEVAALLGKNPFKSPSPEAVFNSFHWGRKGKVM